MKTGVWCDTTQGRFGKLQRLHLPTYLWK